MQKEIELFPGQKDKTKPLFKTKKEYREWCDHFCEKVAPQLKELRIKRMKSERESLIRIVD